MAGSTQCNAHILGGVVVVHLHIAVAGEHQIKPSVPGKQFQHMVQKAASGVDLVAAGAVQIKGQLALGLVGAAFQRYHALCHLSLIHI